MKVINLMNSNVLLHPLWGVLTTTMEGLKLVAFVFIYKYLYVSNWIKGGSVYVSASHARGPWFKPQRLHSSFSLKYSDFVPGMRQARIETNLFIYLLIICTFRGSSLTRGR